MGKRIVVNPVTRIEGHAKITLDLDDQGKVTRGHLQVLEIRGFEKLLEKMELLKMPLMTARLCGVCPAAHHLAAVAAIESGMGVTPPPEAKLLRELLYLGHILHSHALSNFVLSGPDLLLGLDADPAERNVFHLLRLNEDLAKKVLRLRSMGQKTVELIGGRGVHPVTVMPGGMASRPQKKDLEVIQGWGKEALELLKELGDAVRERLAGMADLRQQMTLPYPPLAYSAGGTHTFLEGEIVVKDASGNQLRTFSTGAYAENLVEHVLPGSYMKTVRLKGQEESSYFVGPLARTFINDAFSTALADQQLKSFKESVGSGLSALDYVEARLVEMVHCAERMTQIPGEELTGGPLGTAERPGEGRYVGGIEAPRGILIHDYTANKEGKVTAVNLIVATQNNYDAMDASVTALANHYIGEGDDNLLMNGMEFALRCFDPCLACATHVAGRMPLEVELRSGGRVVRTVERRSQP